MPLMKIDKGFLRAGAVPFTMLVGDALRIPRRGEFATLLCRAPVELGRRTEVQVSPFLLLRGL